MAKSELLEVEGPSAEEKDSTAIPGLERPLPPRSSEFGLTWNTALETGGILVGDDLKIELEVSLIKA